MSRRITLNTKQEKIVSRYQSLHKKVTGRQIGFDLALARLFEKLDIALSTKDEEWKEKIKTHRRAMF